MKISNKFFALVLTVLLCTSLMAGCKTNTSSSTSKEIITEQVTTTPELVTTIIPKETTIEPVQTTAQLSCDTGTDTDFYSVSNGLVTAEKEGYYSWAMQRDDIAFTLDPATTIEYTSDNADTVKKFWVKYSKGDVVQFFTGTTTTAYLYYSTDGVAVVQSGSFELSPIVKKVEPIVYPTITFERTNISDSKVDVQITCAISETEKQKGVLLRNFAILDSSKNELSSSAEYWDVDATEAMFTVSFDTNGTYWLRIYDSMGNAVETDIDIKAIKGDTAIEDGFNGSVSDKEQPTLTYVIKRGSEETGESSTLTVRSNELCTISLGNESFEDVLNAEINLTYPDVYQAIGIDTAGNKTILNIPVSKNDICMASNNADLYSDENRDTFWGEEKKYEIFSN